MFLAIETIPFKCQTPVTLLENVIPIYLFLNIVAYKHSGILFEYFYLVQRNKILNFLEAFF